MKLLRLNFLYLAVVLTSFFNVSHAQITTHEELINAAINKDENNRLIPAKVPLEHIGVIGYDGSYSLEKTKRDYYPVLWIPNSTDFVSKYPDENTLSLVAISDGDVSPAKRMGLVFSLREPGKEAVITPNLYVYTNSSDLIDTGIFVVHDSPESKKRATFENDVTVDMSQQALEGKVEGISFWGVQGIFKKNVYSHAYAGIKTGGSDLVIAGNVFINAERGIHFVGRNSLTANKIHIEASDVAFYSDPIDQSGFQINGKQIDMISPLLRQGFYESDELTINNKGGALLNIYSNFDAKNKVYAPMVVSNSSGRVNITVDNDQSKVLLYFKNMAGGVRGSLSIKNGATVETAFNCRECLSSDLSIRVSQGGRLNIHPISHWEKVDDVGFPQKNESTIPRLDITGGIVEISSPALNYYYISNLSGSHGVLILPFDVPGKELKLSPEEDAETYLWHTPPVHFNLVSQEGDLRVKLNFLNFNKALVEGREFPLFGLVRKSRLKSPYQPPFENSYRNVNARWVQQAMSYLRPVRTEGTLYNNST